MATSPLIRPGRWLARGRGRLIGAAAVGTLLAAGATAALPTLGSADTTTTTAPTAASVTVAGHGFGHGLGMGQWGALGYALAGQGYQAILAHYYGGTTPSTVPNGPIRVRIDENNGNDLIVTSGSAFTVAGVKYSPGQAALMHLAAPGSWQISQAASCAGPWTMVATAGDQGGAGPQAVALPASSDPAAPASQLLQLCMASGTSTLRGSLSGAEINGQARTVETLPLDSYLRGVVPSESPAYWGGLGSTGPQGQAQGFQALEAQAVAARSYAVADQRSTGSQGPGVFGYADICDTTSCQAYRGVAGENPLTDAAIADTAGQVLLAGGSVALTQYSASTGGWTAGGQFPAVEDTGDSVCVSAACNPSHDWTTSISVTSLQGAYPTIGGFQSLAVTSRSGPAQADQSGRVLDMVITGSAGSVQVTGNSFAGAFGLRSNWFQPTQQPSTSPPTTTPPAPRPAHIDGYWVTGANGQVLGFGAAPFFGSTQAMKLNKPLVGSAATPDGGGYWLVASDGGIFSYGDARFFGSTGSIRLNQPIVGMTPTADGGGYWLVASDGGIFSYGDAAFFGSTGSKRLSQSIAGMAATPDGGGYWLVEGDGSVFAFGDAAALGPAQIAAGDQAAGIVRGTTANGYLVVTQHGRVLSFGDAPNFGDVSSSSQPFVSSVLALMPRYGP